MKRIVMTGATHQNHQHLDDIKEVPPTFLAARNLHRHRCLEIPAVILPLNTRHRQKCKPRRYLDLEGGTRSSDIVVVCSQRLYDIEDITVVERAKFTHHLLRSCPYIHNTLIRANITPAQHARLKRPRTCK